MLNFGAKLSMVQPGRNVEYNLEIIVPEEFRNNENITIDLKLEWLYTENGNFRMSGTKIEVRQDFKEISFKANRITNNRIYVNYNHKIKTGKDFQVDYNPGFKLGWSYSGEGIDLTSSPKPVTFRSGELTNSFKRRVRKYNKVASSV